MRREGDEVSLRVGAVRERIAEQQLAELCLARVRVQVGYDVVALYAILSLTARHVGKQREYHADSYVRVPVLWSHRERWQIL